MPRPIRFTPEEVSVPVVQETGRVPVLVWSGAVNLTPTGIRSPASPARSDTLYRLNYLCPRKGRVLLYDVLCAVWNWHRTVGAVIVCFVSSLFLLLATIFLRAVVL
jgi:hypothetical protein